jgi:hypothetical protein
MSRLTFHSSDNNVAWQRQIRDHYLGEGRPPIDNISVKAAKVRNVERSTAERIILKYEWLGTMANSSYHYGIFFGMFCAGVCCVSVGSGTAGSNVNKRYGVDGKRLSTLVRGACVHWAPSGTNSKLVSWTCRLLPKHLKLCTAYADTDAGEIGTIYQACNWVYVGRSGSVRQLVSPRGVIRDEKILYDWGAPRGLNKTRALEFFKAKGWTVQRTNPKHRYVVVLDKSDRKLIERIEDMREPYPKREHAVEATQ